LKQVILSADGPRKVYLVPDAVAELSPIGGADILLSKYADCPQFNF